MGRPMWTDFGFGSESDYETTYRQWQRDRDEGVRCSRFSGGPPSDDEDLYDEFDMEDSDDVWR